MVKVVIYGTAIFFFNYSSAQMVYHHECKDSLSLEKELIFLRDKDQSIRKEYHETVKKHGNTSIEATKIMGKIRKQDSINISVLISLIERCKWGNLHKVSRDAMKGIFYTLQHADLATREKYFSNLAEAATKGKIEMKYIAMMQDRIKVNKNEKQIFGTQIHCELNNGKENCFLWPIENESEVDLRREKVGLVPLAQYLKENGIEK
jgi:hypothetical protein